MDGWMDEIDLYMSYFFKIIQLYMQAPHDQTG